MPPRQVRPLQMGDFLFATSDKLQLETPLKGPSSSTRVLKKRTEKKDKKKAQAGRGRGRGRNAPLRGRGKTLSRQFEQCHQPLPMMLLPIPVENPTAAFSNCPHKHCFDAFGQLIVMPEGFAFCPDCRLLIAPELPRLCPALQQPFYDPQTTHHDPQQMPPAIQMVTPMPAYFDPQTPIHT